MTLKRGVNLENIFKIIILTKSVDIEYSRERVYWCTIWLIMLVFLFFLFWAVLFIEKRYWLDWTVTCWFVLLWQNVIPNSSHIIIFVNDCEFWHFLSINRINQKKHYKVFWETCLTNLLILAIFIKKTELLFNSLTFSVNLKPKIYFELCQLNLNVHRHFLRFET